MATLTYEYPVKISGKVYNAGEPVDERLVAKNSKSEQKNMSIEQVPSENNAESAEYGTDVELTGMSLQQLKDFAKDNGFDITGCNTKAAIIEAIEKA